MGLPVNIEELVNGRTVEWERIECKEGWNPVPILHSICAFANDLNNWGGGYIIIGIEDRNGHPVLPPKGIPVSKIDSIQKELLELCHRLRPNYFPIAEPVDLQDKKILIIWVPGGANRPYSAPEKLSKESKQHLYIRRYSTTKRASLEEERELISLANNIPFDDQINHSADIPDINLTLIQSHLAEIKSAMLPELKNLSISDICRRMNIVDGGDEYLKPKNVGLLFFNENPGRFFRGAQIDVVEFHDEVGDHFTEKIFTGPIQQQVTSALLYIKNNVIAESVQKVQGQAEAIRFFNYPYEAIEESLVNAVYHRSYQDDSPVEVRIFANRIEIISYPGPLPPLNKDNLMDENITARRYRNRRIGDFFKELHLTEGRSTGFRKIRRSLEANGSPEPVFETDDDRGYFLTTLTVHPEARVEAHVEAHVEAQVELNATQIRILSECARNPLSTKEIVALLGHASLSGNVKIAIGELMEYDLIAFTIPDKPRSRLQKYSITESGREVLTNTGSVWRN